MLCISRKIKILDRHISAKRIEIWWIVINGQKKSRTIYYASFSIIMTKSHLNLFEYKSLRRHVCRKHVTTMRRHFDWIEMDSLSEAINPWQKTKDIPQWTFAPFDVQLFKRLEKLLPYFNMTAWHRMTMASNDGLSQASNGIEWQASNDGLSFDAIVIRCHCHSMSCGQFD